MAVAGAGFFSDGRTAARVPVTVQVGPDALDILANDGASLARWPLASLLAVDMVGGGAELRLSTHDAPDARLTVCDAEVAAVLVRRLPALKRGRWRRRRLLAWMAAAVAISGVFVVLLPLASARLAYVVPFAWEEAWGRYVLAGLPGAIEECQGTAGRGALDRLLRRLGTASGMETNFRVHVLPLAPVNAAALPGGHIVVLWGAIDDAATPEELAGVLAHEVAHVARRHVTRRMVREAGAELLSRVVGGTGSAGGVGRGLLDLSYDRDDEREADAAALGILSAANIGGDGLATFLSRQDGIPRPLSFLSSHPVTPDRLAILAGPHPGGPAMSAEDWADVKAICPR